MSRIGNLPSARRNPHNARVRHVERRWYPKKGFVRPDKGRPVPAMFQYPVPTDSRKPEAIVAARTLARMSHNAEVEWIERDLQSWALTLHPNTLPNCTFGPHGGACEMHAYARKTLQQARRQAKPVKATKAQRKRKPAPDALAAALAAVRSM